MREAGFTKTWVRAYAEVPEFWFVVASLALFHFGPRLPLLFGDAKPVKRAWGVRLHRYITDDIYRVHADHEAAGGARFESEEVEQHTVDIRDHNCLQAALCNHPDRHSERDSFRPFQDE